VNTAERFTDIRQGYGFGCALSVASELWCWGLDDAGQLAGVASGPECQQPFSDPPVFVPCSYVPLKVPFDGDFIGAAAPWGDIVAGRRSPAAGLKVPAVSPLAERR
jgi:hypothetical protein